MEDFIRQNYLYINEGVIILAAIVGLICLKKFRNSHARYFIYFLVYVVFIEILGYYPKFTLEVESLNWIGHLTKNTVFEKNFLWYTIFWQMGSTIFLSFYFRKILDNNLFKKVVKNTLSVYILFSIVYSIINFDVFYYDFIITIWILGVCQIMVCIILYFFEILGSEKIISFYKSVEFYVAAVFFIWFLIKTPLSFYQIYYNKNDWSFVYFRRNITLCSNLFMYLTFAFAFVYCKPEISAKFKPH